MNTVALAMIVRGVDEEAPLLAKCLASINGHVDKIYLDINHRADEPVSQKVIRVAEQYDADYVVTEWHDDFVSARNNNFARVDKQYEWILWLDADDTIFAPAKLREVASIAGKNVGGIFAAYDYSHDDLGNVTYTHWIIRLCRNNGAYKWKSSFDDGDVSVHETLQDIRQSTNVRTEDFKVIHHTTKQRGAHSLERNIGLLEGMYERQQAKDAIDPRVLYYLATHYFEAAHGSDAELLTRAETLLSRYLKVSGWAEERSEAWVYMGLIFRLQRRNDAARPAFMHAIMENPANPKPYVELGDLECADKRYAVAEEWLLTAISKKQPVSSTVLMPMENTFRAYMLLAQVYVNMGFSRNKDAKKYVEKALKLRPYDVDAKKAQELIDELKETRDNTKAFLRLSRLLEQDGSDKVVGLVNLLPHDMQDNPAVITTYQKHATPKIWPDKSVAIFCGNSAQGIWTPDDMNTTGMGGSEEAVIHMSNQLTELGYEVTVYATPGAKAGNYNGVEWKQYWEFNPKDTFDVLIAWRMPWFFDADITARKSYLWLHDVMDKQEFFPARNDKMTGVLFVSQYHADLYKDVIPADKRIVSGNGIDPDAFRQLDKQFKRDPHRLIYTSSQLRGLELLYDIWDDVKRAVPDATLDVYYGWETFDAGNNNNPERMAWKATMLKRAAELDGVTDHGRMGQADLNKELVQSGIFAYPCWFPEVYCISLIKAQAAGCYALTSDFAVLKDFNITGKQVHYDPKDIPAFKHAYKKALIQTLKRKTLPPVDTATIRRDFSWRNTAQGWVDHFER